MKPLCCFFALLLFACEGSVGRDGGALAARLVTDTLWGWHCQGEFYYAKARPGYYPDPPMPRPPVPGEVVYRDTVILFISEPCPVAESLNTKKEEIPLDSPQL